MADTVECMPRPRGSRRATPPRSTQIEDEVWLPALFIAKIKGDRLSQIMRESVVRYEAEHRHLLTDADRAEIEALLARRRGRANDTKGGDQ